MYATVIDEEENSILNGRYGICSQHMGQIEACLGYTSQLGSAYSLICYFLSCGLDRVGVTGDI